MGIIMGCNRGGWACEFEACGGGKVKEVCNTGGPDDGLPGMGMGEPPAEVKIGGEPELDWAIWLRMLFKMLLVAWAVFRPFEDMPPILGLIFCFDLGLGWVMYEVVVRLDELVVLVVAGRRVGGARDIWVLPVGGCEDG